MARIRTIKPEFFRHEGLQDLAAQHGAHVMLVFAGLWGHCDKAGRFEWRPRQLKLDILPFLDFDMAATLEILGAGGLLERYEVAGKQYGVINSFREHQRISGKEQQEPEKYPEPTGKHRGSTGEAPETTQNGEEFQEGKRKGREKEGSKPGAADAAGLAKQPKFDPLQAALPASIPKDAWMRWVAYRRERRLTLTERTVSAQIAELDGWAKAGHDPPSIIDTSIAKGWQGLFEPKTGAGANERSEKRAAVLDELTGRSNRQAGGVIEGCAARVD